MLPEPPLPEVAPSAAAPAAATVEHHRDASPTRSTPPLMLPSYSMSSADSDTTAATALTPPPQPTGDPVPSQSTESKQDQYGNNSDIENLPIVVEGRTVGTAIIKHDRKQATSSAYAAASHISTPDDIQFCSFSDGSHGKEHRGGVALAYKHQWLPQKWATESTGPSGDTVLKAWPYGHAVGSMAMECVGVLESLCAANEELERHLPVLTKHSSTVTVKATTDSQMALQYVSRGTLTPFQARKLPPRLIKQIHDLILALQDHQIKVVVELHWCPRNAVPQLWKADEMAGQAMRSGFGYCNITNRLWTEAIESATMKQLEPVLSGAITIAAIPIIPSSAGEAAGKKKTRRGRKNKKRAQRETTPSGAADSHSQLPLPDTTLPPKPATTDVSAKSIASVAADGKSPKEPANAQAGKRKAEEEELEQSEERTIKKAKLSQANVAKTNTAATHSPARPRRQHRPTMPVAWALDPETTTTFVLHPDGGHQETPAPRAPFIRMVLESTQETREKNVFVNDGVSGFCLAQPVLP